MRAGLDRLLALIPDVPCDGCCDCCNGVYPGSLKCPCLVDRKCSVRNDRPLACRLYGAMANKPCFRGRIAPNPLTPDMVQQISVAFRRLTGQGPHDRIKR